MTVQAWIVLDTAQSAAAVALNTTMFAVYPQTIANTLANSLGYGTLVGKDVLPARILNLPDYSAWATWYAGLDPQPPIYVMDSETLFIPDLD